MRKTSRLLAMLLAVAMLAALICIPASAEESDDRYAPLKEGTGYVALGDSFTRGYGASDHFLDQIYGLDSYGNFYSRNVDGSYPNLVAEHFGMYAPDDIRDTEAELWNLGKDAVSVAYMLDLLGIDDGYRDDEFTYSDGAMISRYSTDLRYFGDPESYTLDGTARYGKTGEIMSIRQLLSDAGMISIGLGQTDVIYKAQTLGLNAIDLNDTENLPSAVANLVGMLYEYYEYWKGAYPLLLDFIKENNPDATVVLVSTMNPIQNAVLSEDALVPIGEAITVIMDLMNRYIRQCAEDYGYLFVDISNVETPSSETTMTIGQILGIEDSIEFALQAHPTPDGFAQIARMVISAVEGSLPEVTPSNPKTFISVDLGRFQKVDYVILDGKTVDNYSMDNYVLTIPNYTTTAKTLAVTIVGEDGKTTVMTYSLSYDNGYTATRVYQTNDAEGTAKSLMKKLGDAVKKAWNSFIGLFKP